jgi:hypothetical protein
MPTIKEEKSQANRVKECITILKKLTNDVGIDSNNPSIVVLKKRMGQYWRDGKTQEDTLPLFGYDRMILYKLPKWAHQDVELTLRVSSVRHPPLPPDLEEELRGRRSSAFLSDPSQPSPQESPEK